MNSNSKNRLNHALLLILGFWGMIRPNFTSITWGTGLFTIIWIYNFLELAYRFHSKKELCLTGLVFTAGYCLKFAGAMGNSLLDFALFGIFGLALFEVFSVSAHFMRKWNNFWGTLIFPAFWMLMYLFATLLRLPSLFRVDMMFTDMNVLMLSERLIGSLGFSFVIIWMISLLRYSVSNRKIWCALLSLALFCALLTPGIFILFPNTEATESVRIAYTTGPYGGDFINYVSPSYEESEQSLERSVENAASQGAEILCFNEEAFELDDVDEARFIDTCASLAENNSIAVLLGLDVRDTDESENGKSLNKVVLIGPDGEIINSYQKSRLIPIIEANYVQGEAAIPTTRLKLNGKSIKIAYLICYDSNFPEYVNDIEPDTDILFLPSWDWSAVTEIHAKLCDAIAAENNIYVIKPTYDGISIAIDQDGQIFHKTSTDETGFETVHVVDIPIKSSTVEVKSGSQLSALVHAIIALDIFSVLVCLVLLAGHLVFSTEKSRRSDAFTALAVTNIIGCIADALSWLLDGHTRLNSVVFDSTLLAMLLTIVLIWEYLGYLFEYVREKAPVPTVSLKVFSCISLAVLILTVVMSLNGQLFTVTDGAYSDGPRYDFYVYLNIGLVIYAFITVSFFRKLLTVTDRIAAYSYLLIPVLSAVVNTFIEDFSFAYAATALTLTVLYVMIQSDKVERLQQEGQIVGYRVVHDELTGLFNRRAFEERRVALKKLDGTVGVVFGDLNGLKYTNDNFGHEAGDQLLLKFTSMLMDVFRQNELFRISGDEFVCLMENVEEDVFASRLHELEEKIGQDEQPIAAIGAVFGSKHEIDALVRDAETEMYRNKSLIHERFPEFVR